MKSESPRRGNGTGSADHDHDHEPHIITTARIQFLGRFSIPSHRVPLIAALAFGETPL